MSSKQESLTGDNQKFAVIKYPELNILMDIDKQYSLLSNIKVNRVHFLPSYCDGMAPIQGNPTVIINFARLFNIDDHSGDKVIMYVELKNNEYFAFDMIMPKIIDHKLSNIEKYNKLSTNHMPMISTNYVILDNEIYLRISSNNLFEFIYNELRDKLTKQWLDVDLQWENTLKIPENIISIASSKSTYMQSTAVDDNLVTFSIGNYSFCFEEREFIELITYNKMISDFPSSSKYVEGVVNYNGNNLPVINLAKIFEMEISVDNLLLLVVKLDEENLALLIDDITFDKIDKKDLTRVKEMDFQVSFLYSNIYYNDESIYHQLNLPELANWVFHEHNYSIKKWYEFLKIDPNKYKKLTEIEDKEDRFSNYIGIKVPEFTFVLPIEKILNIRSRDNREEIEFEGVRFVNYKDQWIPSIELLDGLENPISIIIQNNDLLIELISNYVYFENVSDLALDKKTIDKLYSNNNYYGIQNVYVISDGIAFELNTENLMTNILKQTDKSIKKLIKKIDTPIPEEEVMEDTLLQVWQEDIELILLITDINGNTKAIRINNIKEILLETDEKFIPWADTDERSYIYLSFEDNKNKLVYYQIPVKCSLRGVYSDEKSDEIILDDEPVKIIKLNEIGV